MKLYRYAFEPGEVRSINATGDFIRGMSGKERYEIQIDSGPATGFETGLALQTPGSFSQVRITNTAAVAQIIEVAIGQGELQDNRLVGRMDLNGAIGILSTAAASHVTHPAQTISAATEVLPVDPMRRSAIVQCSGEVYVDSTADGVRLTAFTWEAQTALTLVPVAGPVDVRILEERNE